MTRVIFLPINEESPSDTPTGFLKLGEFKLHTGSAKQIRKRVKDFLKTLSTA